MVGTHNNVELSGTRNDLTFSSFIREVPGVRHMDLDMMQICPGCNKPYAVFELTSAEVKHTYIIENIASMMKVDAYLVQHAYNDVDHTKPVTISRLKKGFERQSTTCSWADLFTLLSRLRSKHITQSTTKKCKTETEAELSPSWKSENPEWIWR